MASSATVLEASVAEQSATEASILHAALITIPTPPVLKSAQSPELSRRSRPSSRAIKKKRRRTGENIIAAVVFVFSLLLLWPAQFGGMTGLTVVNGHSMEPTYATNDVVVTMRAPAYAVNDIVTYVIPEGQPGEGGRVIHRIRTVEHTSNGDRLTTQGDNNADVDPWIISSSDVLGKAVFQAPNMGNLVGTKVNPFLVGGVAAALFVMFTWRFTRGSKKKYADPRKKD
jgi:signal peptidase